MPTGIQRLVGITNLRRVLLPGALRRKEGSNRSEKYESRDGNPGLHEPEPTEFRASRFALRCAACVLTPPTLSAPAVPGPTSLLTQARGSDYERRQVREHTCTKPT
jgi:hypothetical protein